MSSCLHKIDYFFDKHIDFFTTSIKVDKDITDKLQRKVDQS
jgi:hypothetical protein